MKERTEALEHTSAARLAFTGGVHCLNLVVAPSKQVIARTSVALDVCQDTCTEFLENSVANDHGRKRFTCKRT